MHAPKLLSSTSLIAVALLSVFIARPTIAEDTVGSPKLLIEKTISDTRNLIVAEKGKVSRDILEAKTKAIIYPVFDFRAMSRRCLGTHWDEGTVKQQKEFVNLFSELLGENYLDTVIDGIEDCTIDFEKERIRGKRALVHSTITKDDRVQVDYRFLFKNNKWRVYDVIIENIGLVSNHRNEFAATIRREKFSGLLVQIREKVGRHRTERANRPE